MVNYFEKLKSLSRKAYTPYSNFHVSAICVLKDGTEVSGVNVENAAYSVTTCAERTCLSQVYTLGYKKKILLKFFYILIVTKKDLHVGCVDNFYED